MEQDKYYKEICCFFHILTILRNCLFSFKSFNNMFVNSSFSFYFYRRLHKFNLILTWSFLLKITYQIFVIFKHNEKWITILLYLFLSKKNFFLILISNIYQSILKFLFKNNFLFAYSSLFFFATCLLFSIFEFSFNFVCYR